MKKQDFKNKPVTIMGLGLHGGGLGVALFLAQQGARLTITDLKSKEELAKPLATEDGASHGLAVSEAAERKEESMPAAEEANVEDSVTANDDRLDAVDRNLIKVVERLERAGLRPTDELVASNMHPNPKTELSYNRVTINRRRCKLRDKGYNV